MRVLLATAFVMIGSVYAFAQTPAYLNDDQLRKSLIGNTIQGVEDGKSYFEFLKPDGAIAGLADDGKYTGAWRILKNQICFTYEDKGSKWDCSTVILNGDNITWTGDETAKLLSGDPKRL